MKYNPRIVAAFFEQHGLGKPEFEYRFHTTRKWRFDIAWPQSKIAIEVQGGIWSQGAHSRGAGQRRDMEKHNAATSLGWRVFYVEPKNLCLMDTISMLWRVC
jgi:hypothetical protein